MAADSDSDEPVDAQGTCFGLGSCAHAPRFATFGVRTQDDCWLFMQRRSISSLAHESGVLVECARLKLKAAADFIDLFPHFVDPTDWFKSATGEQERGRRQVSADAEPKNSGESTSARAERSLKGMLTNQRSAQDSVEEQKSAILSRTLEKLAQQDSRVDMSVYRQSNRLDANLTEDDIQLICNTMYDGLTNDNGSPDTPSIVVTSIEAALMAWDLTSQLEGAWRVPVTLLSKRDGIKFSYVCVMLCIADHVGILGRSCVKDTSLIPLARQRVSDAIHSLAKQFAHRGHLVKTVYLGVPTPCPVSLLEAREAPVVWRYLKMNCSKQRWSSIKSTSDVFVNRAAEIRAAALGSTPLPRGLVSLPNCRGAPRIKAAHPLLARHQRPPKLRKLPPMGKSADGKVFLPGGVWDATSEEMCLVRTASPPDVMVPRAKGSVLHETVLKNAGVDTRKLAFGNRSFSARSGSADARHPPRDTLRGISFTAGELQAEGRLPEASFDADFQHEDCSSVSSASAEEWLEDWRLASASLWEVQDPPEAPPRPYVQTSGGAVAQVEGSSAASSSSASEHSDDGAAVSGVDVHSESKERSTLRNKEMHSKIIIPGPSRKSLVPSTSKASGNHGAHRGARS